MCRKMASLAVILWLAASTHAYALGLGDIEVQSALNEPFRAVIALTTATDEELDELKVKVASREAFQRAGIPRPLLLNEFLFKVERTDSGKPVIRISTRDAVDEPFLDFLLEIAWARGRLVRQYTVLIDPPYTMPATPVVPRAPVTRAPPAEAVPAPAPEPEYSRPAPVAPPPQTSRPAPVPASPPPPSAQPAVDHYGPVRRNETLWDIASRLRPDREISIQQMMLALQRSNPDAFANNNINNLKAGAVLAVPLREEIVSLSRSEAIREARRQYDQWQADRETQTARTGTAVSQDVADVTTETRLQLVAPEEELTAEAVEGTAAPGTPEPAPEAAAEDNANLQQQLAMAADEAEADRSQSGELMTRVTELEAQVTDMRRLLELKDAQLASLQNRLDAVEEKPAAEAPVAEPQNSASGETGAADTSNPESTDSSATEEPGGLIDRLLDNPVLTALGVLVAMILGGFIWASTRQRKQDDLFSDEPTLASRLSESLADAEPVSPGIIVNENRAFSELPGDEISPLASDAESDPLTEADVFIAYGRVQQAEDVIKNALKKSPENPDLKLKLMEVFHAAGNAAAFDTYADGLRRQVDLDDPLWMKVAVMGHELSPENPAYKIAAGGGKTETDVDFDMDLSGMEGIEQESDDEGMADDELGLDYVDRDQATTDQPEKVDFNLEDLDLDTTQEHAGEEDELEGLLDSSDEVGTKLDLARAYIDMGDPDSARNILEEVLEEGNSDQKHEAENLVSQLA